MSKKVFFSLLLLVAILSSFAFAADPTIDPPPQTDQEISINQRHNKFLREQNYADLDAEMNQIQSEYEQGTRDDVSLLHLFYAFYDADPDLAKRFDAWISTYPKSYAAHLAKGIFLRRIARKVRGVAYISETAPRKLETMEDYLVLSIKELNLSLELSKRPMLSYYNMLCICRLIGDREGADYVLAKANEMDAGNFIIRYKYMDMLQTRWGGSLQQMQDFREQISKAGLSDELLRYFDDFLSEERKWLKENPVRPARDYL